MALYAHPNWASPPLQVDRDHMPQQVQPSRQHPAAWPGNGDHPLLKTHFGQDPVHPVSGQARNSAASARRAEATASA